MVFRLVFGILILYLEHYFEILLPLIVIFKEMLGVVRLEIGASEILVVSSHSWNVYKVMRVECFSRPRLIANPIQICSFPYSNPSFVFHISIFQSPYIDLSRIVITFVYFMYKINLICLLFGNDILLRSVFP